MFHSTQIAVIFFTLISYLFMKYSHTDTKAPLMTNFYQIYKMAIKVNLEFHRFNLLL